MLLNKCHKKLQYNILKYQIFIYLFFYTYFYITVTRGTTNDRSNEIFTNK